jgi:hypothetical protein
MTRAKNRMRNRIFILPILFMVSSALYPQQQSPLNIYIVSTGIEHETLPLFSAPGRPFEIGSVETAKVRAGDVGKMLEISEDKRWYKMQLPDGGVGWISPILSGTITTKIQVGGNDPRLFVTLITASGRKMKGFLKKRSKTDGQMSDIDLGIVTVDDFVDFQDPELGTIRLLWKQVKAVLVNDSVAVVNTLDGNNYRARGLFGMERTSKKVEAGFMVYRDVGVDISLWLTNDGVSVKITYMKAFRLER